MAERTGNLRWEWGWGPSPLASEEEKQAYTARQVRAGKLPVTELPEAYGGMPTGNTRRAIRAREVWVQQQKYLSDIAEQQRQAERVAMEAERLNISMRAEERQQRDQNLEIQKIKMLEDRESRVQKEAGIIFDSIFGRQVGVDQNGNPIMSKPLSPQDPDALKNISNLMKLQYGIQHPAAKEALQTLFNDASQHQQNLVEDAQKQMEQQRTWLIGQQEEAASLGVDTSKYFVTKQDPQTKELVVTGVDQIGLAKAIGEAKRNDLETKKREVAMAKIDEDSRSQARSVLDDINKIDSEIRKANFNAQKESDAKLRQEHINNSEFFKSERDILVQRFNSLVPQQRSAQPQQVQQPQTTGQRPALGDIFGGR